MAKEKHPFVSVVVPVRNEEKYIRECLDSLLDQDYPRERYEIIVIDGRSEDKTRHVIRNFIKHHENVRLFENPQVNTAIGRNIGIRNSTGDMVINFNGHSRAERGFISLLVQKLRGADDTIACVGCKHETPSDDPFVGKAIGLAMESKFGSMGTTFVPLAEERFVDSVGFAAYRKKVLEEVGMFDPGFWVGDDAELNMRIKKAGYKLLYIPKTMVYHHKRGSLSKFSRQIFNYGVARMKMIRKHPSTLRALYFMPSLFVLALIFLGILSLFIHVVFYPFLVVICAYFVCALISSAAIAWKHGAGYLALPIIYFIEHAAYGLGFLWGIRR